MISKSSFLFRQNDIRTKFYFFDIRLAMPLAYLGGKKTGFYFSRSFFYFPQMAQITLIFFFSFFDALF